MEIVLRRVIFTFVLVLVRISYWKEQRPGFARGRGGGRGQTVSVLSSILLFFSARLHKAKGIKSSCHEQRDGWHLLFLLLKAA